MVLVRPGSPANVGASARALRNAGLDGLDLVEPGDWRTVECWRTAWGAQDVLEEAREFTGLRAALAGSSYVVALSGRPEAGPAPLDVRAVAAEIAGLGPEDRAALVFGPETTGLTRDELAACGRCAFIPSHPGQPSLNLSHAVMVAGYEVLRARGTPAPRPRAATADEKDAMLALLRRGLRAVQALPEQGAEGAFREWEQMVQRAPLSPKEVRLLEHMARKMAARGEG